MTRRDAVTMENKPTILPEAPAGMSEEPTKDATLWIEGSDDKSHGHEPMACKAQDQPRLLRFLPRLFRYDDNAPPEASGLALDIFARAVVVMSSMFIGPALLQLATEASQEQCIDDCSDGRIHGMKPSSLLTNIAIASGLIGSFILPLFGAIVDHTPYRRHVGVISALLITIIKGLEIMISSSTWFAVAIMQVISGIVFLIHICATFAYTSELSVDPAQQTKYNAYYNVVLYIATLLFLVLVLSIAGGAGLDDVLTARVSQIITTCTCAVFFGLAWTFLFRDRPALSQVPEGSSLLLCGFKKICTTTGMIWSDLPALKWFIPAVMLNEAATAALVTIGTTYMSEFLGMTATEIAMVFLVVLLFGIPGTKLGERVALRYNPVLSAKVCCTVFIIATALAALVLEGPEDKYYVMIFGAVWGTGLGWLHPMDSTIFMTIIPKGQESELMGMYIFSSQVLSWLPPLAFTFLNEAGVAMNIGLASLNIFFILGLCCLCCMGSYDKALEHARLRSNNGYVVSQQDGVAAPSVALPRIT